MVQARDHSKRRASGAIGAWDALASRYEAQEHLEARAICRALRLAATGPDERLVDLGCGTGVLLRALATPGCRPASAVGVDRSARMLERVGPLPAGWRTLQADARAVPLPDGCADVVTCCYLLHLLCAEDRVAVLRQARRLLAPGAGARLVVVSVWTGDATIGARLLRRGLRALARSRPDTLGGLMPLDPAHDLRAAGLVATHRVQLIRGGYPSVVLRARPLGAAGSPLS